MKISISLEELQELYINQDKTINEIRALYNCSRQTIFNKLNKFGIRKRLIDTSFKNLIGKKFGRLKVLEHKGFVNHQTIWLCKCICGNFTEVRASSLIRGTTMSCG